MALSRLVELNRLTLQTRQEEEKEFASLGRKDPDRVVRLPSENSGGVREVYTKVKNFMNDIFISYHYVDLDTQGGRSLDP